jgi:hypothetical protein
MSEPSVSGELGRLRWAWEWHSEVPLRGRTSSGAGDARGASYHVDRLGTFPLL